VTRALTFSGLFTRDSESFGRRGSGTERNRLGCVRTPSARAETEREGRRREASQIPWRQRELENRRRTCPRRFSLTRLWYPPVSGGQSSPRGTLFVTKRAVGGWALPPLAPAFRLAAWLAGARMEEPAAGSSCPAVVVPTAESERMFSSTTGTSEPINRTREELTRTAEPAQSAFLPNRSAWNGADASEGRAL
jgi:hypothetical protein